MTNWFLQYKNEIMYVIVFIQCLKLDLIMLFQFFIINFYLM